MLEALKHPFTYIAAALVAVQFLTGVVLDLMIGGALVAMIAVLGRSK